MDLHVWKHLLKVTNHIQLPYVFKLKQIWWPLLFHFAKASLLYCNVMGGFQVELNAFIHWILPVISPTKIAVSVLIPTKRWCNVIIWISARVAKVTDWYEISSVSSLQGYSKYENMFIEIFKIWDTIIYIWHFDDTVNWNKIMVYFFERAKGDVKTTNMIFILVYAWHQIVTCYFYFFAIAS